MTTQTPEAQHAPTYHDPQLASLMRAHRASIRNNPEARKTLALVEFRLKYLLRLLRQWDELHAGRAEQLIRLGNLPAANTAASMIFDDTRRAALYDRTPIGFDQADVDRLIAVIENDRQVLV